MDCSALSGSCELFADLTGFVAKRRVGNKIFLFSVSPINGKFVG